MVNSTRSTPIPSSSRGMGSSDNYNSTLDDEPALHPTLIHYNHTTPKIFHGISGIGIDPGIIGGSGIFTSPGAGVIGQGKHCIDLHGRKIPSSVHYVPGPDECTLCVCEDGGPKWCKAVLCSPPMDCSSFRVGNSCCEFICLDDTLNKKGGGAKTGGGFNGPFDVGDVVPKIIVVAITAILSLSLLLFLIHRLRQKQIQGRLNSSVARRCDDCDESRSLDFSMDYFVDRGPPPPPYLAWWKPPSTYFPPRGEAPPPYEEAIASTSNCLPMTFTAAYTNAAPVNVTSTTVSPNTGSSTCVINPNGIATTTLITATTVATVSAEPSSSSQIPPEDSSPIPQDQLGSSGASSEVPGSSAGPSVTFRKDSSGLKSKKRNFKSISTSSDPQPGPSCSRRRLNETEDIIRRTSGGRVGGGLVGGSVQLYPQHLSSMQVPPTYDDSIMEVPFGGGRQYFRHSLSLPRRGGGISDQPLDQHNASHPFCPRIGTVGGSNGGCNGRHNTNQEAQRYSLQFHIADHCWSSASSSTLSLSTPNSPNGLSVRPPSLSSSSSSNVSNTHHV